MKNAKDLPKVSPEEINLKTQATVTHVAEETGQDAAFVGKAIRNANLQAVATVKTGKPGRPPLVFNRTELFAAVDALVQEELKKTVAKTSQTNTEEPEELSQVS